MSMGLSCTESTAREPLSEEDIENLLYDYQLAQALAQQKQDSADIYRQVYIDAVLEKHQLTAPAFDSILLWYATHPKLFAEIFKRVEERFVANAKASPTSSTTSKNITATKKNTHDLWKGETEAFLTAENNNLFKFLQPIDTLLSQGDIFYWRFSTQWIYREGLKAASVGLMLLYENDSVAQVTNLISNSGEQALTLVARQGKVKEIRGFIQHNVRKGGGVKMLYLNHFELQLERQKETSPKKESNTNAELQEDPTNNIEKSLQDSLLRPVDQPHFR